MSKVVDERVVSMQFDNSHFEKNVKTTMSTLDKLKQSLNLKGSAKALEDVGNAAGKVNLSPLSSGVETVTAKFSALQVMGVTALANLTNSAVDSAKRIVRAFTIDPVKTGFNEYELKMGSIQTIMAGTGESLETVNEYLQELNEYSDKTIYSFKDMTSNIGKFTNAGVSLEKAVLAIKGVSNEAALSGANANEASRAMYNFSQALSAGYVKLIDWKSIENANMATVEFKNQLLQTALEMGELEDAGDGMYRTLNGKLVNATHNFNDTLQEQWMTSDVLIETLGRYASTTTDIGKKASAAATEVKTFSMMMDTLKEAAQSGWAMSWEIIFGDFNEGKSLWTSLSGAIGGVIDKMSDARNAFLRSALGTALTDAGKAVKKINAPLATIQTSVKNITSTMEDLSKIADDVLNGAFGNGAERLRALTDAGYNYYDIQNRVNEKLGDSFRYTDKQIQAQDELLGIQTKAVETTTETVKTVDELTEAEIDNIVALSKLGDEQLRSMGYSNKQISAFRELKSVSEHYGVTLKELLTLGDKFNGRWLLIDSFKNIGNAISKVFGGIGKAWESQWGDVDAVAGVQNMLASLHRFSEGLGNIDDIVDKVTRIAKGVFAFTRIMTSFSTRFALTILDIVRGLLGITKWDILGFLANVSDSIVAVRDAIFFNKSLAIGLDGLAPKVVNAAAAVAEWIRSFGKLPGVQKSIESIKASFKAAFDTILGFFKGEIPIEIGRAHV